MSLHYYASIHGTTREQEKEYHYPPPPLTEKEIEDLSKEMAEESKLRRLFREGFFDDDSEDEFLV